MANKISELKAVCIASAHREFKDSHYSVNTFLCEDGTVCEFSDRTDTLMPSEKISSYDDLLSGKAKAGLLKTEEYVFRNKRAVGYKGFDLV